MNRKCLILATVVALSLLVASQSYAYPSALPVNLGAAGNFTILAGAGITTTPGTLDTSIVGNIGVSPVTAAAMTGFGLVMDPVTNTFSTSSLVTGKVYAANYTEPTPTNMTAAIIAMLAAYGDAAGRDADVTGAGASGEIGSLTLVHGVYKWTTPVTMATDLTLSGGADDVWIFQIAGTLGVGATASGANVILTNGAQAKNIFWQVAGQTTIFPTSEFKGTILGATGIAMQDGATLDGRALAGTAVTLIGNTITPEPCTILLLGSGLAGLVAARRRARSAA